MTSVSIGEIHEHCVQTAYEHTAEAFGNPGVRVVGTPALIGFVETAAHRCLEPYLTAGECTVGTVVDVQHLAPAAEGATISARARVRAVDGRKIEFEVEARAGDRVLMAGRHDRAILDVDRFMTEVAPEKTVGSGATT